MFIGNESSTYRDINIGIPQGSVLGPLLFLLYVNDLQFTSSILQTIVFADDTNIFLSGKDVNSLCLTFNNELRSVSNWFLANKLKLNVDKTCCMLFKPKNKIIVEDDVNIYINSCKIPLVKSTKFLGIIIDNKLSWKEHIGSLCTKVRQGIDAINRLNDILPLSILFHLYQTMILPHLTYCNIIWGNCAMTHLSRLITLQKYAIRIITNSKPRVHTGPLFRKLKLLKLYDLYVVQTARFMYLFKNEKLPSLFDSYFVQNKNIVIYSTRQSEDFRVPNYKYELSRSTIKYSGPITWNNLPKSQTQCSSLSIFTRQLKANIINSYI